MENTSSIKRPGSPFTISVLLSQTPNPKSSLGWGGGSPCHSFGVAWRPVWPRRGGLAVPLRLPVP